MNAQPLSLNDIQNFMKRLAAPVDDPNDAARYERIAVLESLKAACAAAQVGPTVTVNATTTAPRVVSDGTEITRIDSRKTVASELGLARKTSPTADSHWNVRAGVLFTEMPHTLALMAAGVLTEKRAEILIRETTGLTTSERQQIDRELCENPDTLRNCGDRSVEARAKARAIALNNKAVADRARTAERERRVTSRPAPDCMAYLTALVPMAQSVAVWATLRRDADSLIATGESDGRTRDQIMADLLVTRVLGTESARAIPATVNVIVSDRTLLGGGDAAAHVDGYGPVPASILLHAIADPDAASNCAACMQSPRVVNSLRWNRHRAHFRPGCGGGLRFAIRPAEPLTATPRFAMPTTSSRALEAGPRQHTTEPVCARTAIRSRTSRDGRPHPGLRPASIRTT